MVQNNDGAKIHQIHPFHPFHPSTYQFLLPQGTIPIRPNVLLEVNVVSHLYPPARQIVLKNLHLRPMRKRRWTERWQGWWMENFNQPSPQKIVGVFTNIIYWFGKKLGVHHFLIDFINLRIFFGGKTSP